MTTLDYRNFTRAFLQEYIELRKEYPNQCMTGPHESHLLRLEAYLSQKQEDIKAHLSPGLETKVTEPTLPEQQILTGLRKSYQIAEKTNQELLASEKRAS